MVEASTLAIQQQHTLILSPGAIDDSFGQQSSSVLTIQSQAAVPDNGQLSVGRSQRCLPRHLTVNEEDVSLLG